MTLVKEADVTREDALRVLLIDDERDAYILTRDMLDDVQSRAYSLEWSADPGKGVGIAALGNYDVCVVDFSMGAYKGDEVVAAIRDLGCTVPVVMLTNDMNMISDLVSMDAGACDYLVKGEVDPTSLERALRYAVDRHLQEVAVRESEARYRALFDSTLDAVIVTSPLGRIFSANPAACHLFRLTERQLMAAQNAALFADNQPEATATLRAQAEGVPFQGEMLFKRGDGSSFRGEVSLAAFPANDVLASATMVIRDVSGRHDAEEARHQAEAALHDLDRRFRKLQMANLLALPACAILCAAVFAVLAFS